MTTASTDWNAPETVRKIAKDRAATLKDVRTRYQLELDDAVERYDEAMAAVVEARMQVDALHEKLDPLPGEIAHLEAIALSEDASWAMFAKKES